MKAMVPAALAAASCVVLLIGEAGAASPAYCALYAREYADGRIIQPKSSDALSALRRIEDQAYYRCLNQDEPPEFPASSAYFGASAEEILGDYGDTIDPMGEGDVSMPDEIVDPEAAAPPAAPPTKPKTRTASAAKSGSGLKPWSPEWIAWCKDHYRSFNETTGMVMTFSGERKLCP